MSEYFNLKEAMAREAVTMDDLAAVTGSHRNTIAGKLNGEVQAGFGIEDAFTIRNARFKKYSLEWLFYKAPASDGERDSA